jgi:hypothetical protein
MLRTKGSSRSPTSTYSLNLGGPTRLPRHPERQPNWDHPEKGKQENSHTAPVPGPNYHRSTLIECPENVTLNGSDHRGLRKHECAPDDRIVSASASHPSAAPKSHAWSRRRERQSPWY